MSKPGQVNIGDLSLQVLAVQSGGLALYGNNDTTALLQQCMADTHAYYQISFTPAVGAQRDEYHHLEVVVNRPRGAVPVPPRYDVPSTAPPLVSSTAAPSRAPGYSGLKLYSTVHASPAV